MFAPLEIDGERIAAARATSGPFDGRGHNLIPLRTITTILGDGNHPNIRRQLGGNAAAFVPLGFLLPLHHPRFRSGRAAVTAGFLASLLVEVLQVAGDVAYGYPWKAFDVDDLILNTAGAAIGWALWRGGAALVGGRDAVD